MTSDAKVGLLLGLVFIFIIAFLINGLPSFRADKNNNELTNNYMVNSPDRVIGIGSEDVKLLNGVKQSGHPAPASTGQTSGGGDGLRFETPLPNVSPEVNHAVNEVVGPDGNAGQAAKVNEVDGGNVTPAASGSVNPQTAKGDGGAKEQTKQGAGPVEYVVKAGDTMSGIAKRFYGPVEGNKLSNIERIFKANEKVVAAIDFVCEGQKLVIPPLAERAEVRKSPADVLKGPMFEKTDSVAPSRVSSIVPPKAVKRELVVDKTRYYTVKDGENLWRIAVQQLGDGNRYKEIVRLNAGVLKDEDAVPAGVKLRLPLR